MKNYVIGITTGRAGSKSLAYLLNNCQETDIAHEWVSFWKRHRIGKFLLPWKFDYDSINERIDYLKSLDGLLVGDVAFYYLNYISYLEKHLYPLKVIYLYRDKEHHLKSQIRVTAENKKRDECCHWLPHNHPEFIKNKYTKSGYDNALPQFPLALNKEDSINKYWEYYQKRAKGLKKQFPEIIFFLQTKELNNLDKQKELFDFLEIPEINRKYQIVRK